MTHSVSSADPGQPARTARNAVALALAELVGKVASVVLAIVVARTLGDTGFGVFAFALSFSLLLATVPIGGFTTVLVQRASAAPEQLDRLLTQMLGINTALGVPVFVIVGGVVTALRPSADAAVAVVLMLVAAMVEVWVTTLRGAAQVRQRQSGVALALVVQRVGTTALACLVLVMGGGVLGLTSAYLAGTLLGAGAVVRAVRQLGVGLDRSGLDVADGWATIRSSFPISVDNVVSMALFRFDVVLLGLLATDAAVGHYSAAYRLLETVLFLTWTLNNALFPTVAADPSFERVAEGLRRGLAVAATAYLPFGVLLLLRPEDLLSLLYGGNYVEPGAPVLRWLALAPMAFAIGYFTSYALLALERRGQVLAASVIAAVVNVAGNLALIPLFGATGAAAATTVCYALEGVILVRWLRARVGGQPLALLRPFMAPAVATAPFALVLLVPLPVLVVTPLAGAVYLGTWLLVVRRVEPEVIGLLAGLVGRR